MASNKTPNLNLPQYSGTDLFNLEEINESYKKIDNSYKEINDNYNKAIQEGSTGNLEVIDARGGYDNLGQKIKSIDSSLEQKTSKVELEVERKRIDGFISLSQGSTTGDAELIDGRIGAEGEKYANIGSAIREQVSALKNVLEVKINPNLLNPAECVLDKFPTNGSNINDVSSWSYGTGYLSSNIIDTSVNKTLVYLGAGSYQCYCLEAGDNGIVLRGTAISNKVPFTVGSDCEKAVLKITYNSTWKENFMISYNQLPANFIPFGNIKNRIDKIDEKINNLIEKATSNILLVPDDKVYFEKKPTLLLCFDGWKKASFDLFAPYLKEKGICFTVFSGFDTINQPNYWTGNDIRKSQKDYGMELGLYTRQPAITYSYLNNWDDQFNQAKVAIDTCKNLGFKRPLIASYSGGQHTTTTEEILQKVYGFRLARTTDEGEIVVDRSLFNVKCSSLGGETWVTWGKKLVDSIITNGCVKSLMTHNLISEVDTDSTYNVTEAQFKEVVDYIATKVNAGQLQCLTYEDFYKQIILPKTSEIGTHAFVNEIDGNQHEYVYTKNGWIELTNYAYYK